VSSKFRIPGEGTAPGRLFSAEGLGNGVEIDIERRKISVGVEFYLLGVHELLGDVNGIGFFDVLRGKKYDEIVEIGYFLCHTRSAARDNNNFRFPAPYTVNFSNCRYFRL
jgi:hypothetical protein